jgi:hypothetical protein
LAEIVGIIWSELHPVYAHMVPKRSEHGQFIKTEEGENKK